VTDSQLPAPLVPPEIDLRGLGYMPLWGNHLFGSDFNASCNADEWRAGLTLWWAAWNQQPAGSLPDNDWALCRHADLGKDLRTWKRIKRNALSGFIKCSDGRLYHKFLCKQVLIAWDKRMKRACERDGEKERQRKLRMERKTLFEQLKTVGVVPKFNTTMEELRELVTIHVTRDAHRDNGCNVTRTVTAKTGRFISSVGDPEKF
jgi:hypothetical protein